MSGHSASSKPREPEVVHDALIIEWTEFYLLDEERQDRIDDARMIPVAETIRLTNFARSGRLHI